MQANSDELREYLPMWGLFAIVPIQSFQSLPVDGAGVLLDFASRISVRHVTKYLHVIQG